MTFEFGAVARTLGLKGEGPIVTGWSIDTRTLVKGDLFFALRGPNHDGHQYVAAALAAGASGAVVERPDLAGPGILVVPETLAALQQLACWARKQWAGDVVGITGSAGKTTTKDVVAHLLASGMKTGKTVGNFNNHFGLPLSILRLPSDSRVGVLEMGMNHAGEIAALAKIALPDVGVVTNVGTAHIENFPDGIEGIARAKRELIEGLKPGGTAVLNADDPRVASFAAAHQGPVVTYGTVAGATVRAEEIAGGRFRVGGDWFETPLPGRIGILNTLAGLAVARVFGIAAAKLQEAVRTLSPGKMRGERFTHRGVTVWNDCYNANPEAMRAMLDVLKETPARRRIAVLGEMLELGLSAESLHRSVGDYAAGSGIDTLIGISGAARFLVEQARSAGLSDGAALFFENPEAAGDYLKTLLRDGDAVLFKGSRGVRVERALERYLEAA